MGCPGTSRYTQAGRATDCQCTSLSLVLGTSGRMVVRYACMGCTGDPSFFTTYHGAAVHLARSSGCRQNDGRIATVVMPNRPTDAEAGGSGAAAPWTAPTRIGRSFRPCLSAAAARNNAGSMRIHILYQSEFIYEIFAIN